MYVDKLDGRIDASLYDQMSEQWRAEQDKITRKIARHQAADRSYREEGVRLIELGQGARRLFAKQEAREQRRLLNIVLSNSTWKDGELTATFRQPFDLIAKATAAASGGQGGGGLNSPKHPAWLTNGSKLRPNAGVRGGLTGTSGWRRFQVDKSLHGRPEGLSVIEDAPGSYVRVRSDA
jgi:hypothetical protein